VRPDVSKSDLPDLNERAQQYVGRSLVVAESIENGRGKVRVGDSVWQAEGPDVPVGSRVKVTGARGTVLVVVAERATV
jgi:membrane protein implicated in regulation of membrane protease activity